jgi:transketolase
VSDKLYSMREQMGNTLVELGKTYNNLVVLDADVSKSTMTKLFKNTYKKRFFNMGIAEQDMMSTAAGMATAGLIPVVSTFAIFAIGRAFEQLRNSVCYPNLNVKVVGTHAGISVGPDGASHQTIEDIAITRVLPNIKVIVPSDIIEVNKLLKQAIEINGPIYFRVPRISLPILHKNEYKPVLGKIDIIKEGKELTIISNGVMLSRVLKAVELLENEGVSTAILNLHTIKPLDKDTIIKYAKKTKKIMVVEEHSVIGGSGSAVSEVVSQHYPVKMKILGIEDKFAESGEAEELLNNFNLSIDKIVQSSLKLVQDF